MVKMVHEAGAKYSYFSTGYFEPHLDTLLRIGVDILEAVWPYSAGFNDMRRLKERVGDRICLWGGIDPDETIGRGTKGEIRREVIDVILAGAIGGGFVLGPAGSLYYDGEGFEEKVMTLIEAGHEYGRYPIDVARLKAELERYS